MRLRTVYGDERDPAGAEAGAEDNRRILGAAGTAIERAPFAPTDRTAKK